MRYDFSMIPASSGPAWFFVVFGGLMLCLLLLFGYLVHSSRHTLFEVSPDGLRIRTAIYGRRIPASSLHVDGARAVDLDRERAYSPKWRTNGVGLPGYGAGWFKLQNGEKALAFLTDRRRVVYLPTSDGFSMLLSVPEPEEFLRALREMESAS